MWKWVITLVAVLILAGIVSFQMLSMAKVNCSLCIEFQGRRQCSEARGPDESTALDEAHRNACAVLTSGVTETLACQRMERQSPSCSNKRTGPF